MVNENQKSKDIKKWQRERGEREQAREREGEREGEK